MGPQQCTAEQDSHVPQPAVDAVLDALQELFGFQDTPLTCTQLAIDQEPQISFLAVHKCSLFHRCSECWCWKNRKKSNQAFNVFRQPLCMFQMFMMAGAMFCIASVCWNHWVLIPTVFIQSGLMKKHWVIHSPGFAYCVFVFTGIKYFFFFCIGIEIVLGFLFYCVCVFSWGFFPFFSPPSSQKTWWF